MKKFNISLIVFSFAAGVLFHGHAQELRESVTVEGIHTPLFRYAERIDRLPAPVNFPVEENLPAYSLGIEKGNFTPSSPAIPASSCSYSPIRNNRGYIRLTSGSYLNSNLSAGYKVITDSLNSLSLRLQHNSTSLWHPFKGYALNKGNPRFSYQGRIGIDFQHLFSGKGFLTASAQYHLGYFNYFALSPDSPRHSSLDEGETPTQTLNDASLRMGWESISTDRTSWNADASGHIFSYRTGTRESHIAFRGSIKHDVSNTQSFGMKAAVNALLYTASQNPMLIPDNYGGFNITPFYEWRNNDLSLRTGVNLAFLLNADGSSTDKGYSPFHAAPDLRLDLHGRNAAFYIHLLGGEQLHTLASSSEIDPYRNPFIQSTQPVYTPLDANIGFELRPFAGFRTALNLRYKISRHVPMGGWFATLLNYGFQPVEGLIIPQGCIPLYGCGLERYDLAGLGAELMLDYSPSDILSLSFEGSYTPQHDRTGIFNGFDRPRWILNAALTLRPIKPLEIGLNYDYRGVRNIFTGYSEPAVTATPLKTERPKLPLARLRLPDITRLNVCANWKLPHNITAMIEADNLLNQREMILPSTPSEGITFSAGIQWIF